MISILVSGMIKKIEQKLEQKRVEKVQILLIVQM